MGGVLLYFFQEYAMNAAEIREMLPAIVRPHVPSNIRNFEYAIIDNQPKDNSLGFRSDPRPFEGKVIAYTDEAMIVKEGRKLFKVVDKAIASQCPPVGSKVEVIPYARKDFNGVRVDKPEEEVRTLPDGTQFRTKTVILGGRTLVLPLPKPKCLELEQMKEQLENLPAPDGFRRITHLLADAGARDFSMVDPSPKNIIATPPAIYCSVNTRKFKGDLGIIYDRGRDTYVLELKNGDEVVERIENVYFDDLGERLAELIDDGEWQIAQVNILPAKQRLNS